MNNERELEQRLQSRRLPSPAPSLRESVLRSVAEELQEPSSAPPRPWGLAVAACLLLSVMLNVATNAAVEWRIAGYMTVDGMRSDNLADAGDDGLPAGSMIEGLAQSPWLSRFASPPRRPSFDDYQAYLATLGTGSRLGDVGPHGIP